MDDTVAASDIPSMTLERANLKDQIVRAIRMQILTGRMRPDKTYSMGALAERFGASRTPIREAVLELEAKGLVEITRGVGFRVRDPSAKEWQDALAVRELLEVPAMVKLAGHLDQLQLAEATRRLELLGQAAEANDIVLYLERDMDFHLYLVQLLGNAKLTQMVRDLREAQRVPGLAAIAYEGSLSERHTEHEQILDAIESGDGNRVEFLLTEHLALSTPRTFDRQKVR